MYKLAHDQHPAEQKPGPPPRAPAQSSCGVMHVGLILSFVKIFSHICVHPKALHWLVFSLFELYKYGNTVPLDVVLNAFITDVHFLY